MPPVVASLIRIACPERLERPAVYLPIMPWHTSCASHDVCEDKVRRQSVCAAGRSRKAVCVGLRTAGDVGIPTLVIVAICRPRTRPPGIVSNRVSMTGQLRHGEGRAAHSAGQAGRRPCKLRQPPYQAVRIMYASA